MKNSFLLKTTLLVGSVVGFGYSRMDHYADEKQDMLNTIALDSTALAAYQQKIDFKCDSIGQAYYARFDKDKTPIPADQYRDDQLNAMSAFDKQKEILLKSVEENEIQIQTLDKISDQTNAVSVFLSGVMLGSFLSLGARSIVRQRKASRKKLDVQ